MNSSLNLNLLAIEKTFSHKELAKNLFIKFLENLKEKDDFNFITVETNNERTEFYKKKLNFYFIGKKIRLFKNLKFSKDLNEITLKKIMFLFKQIYIFLYRN